MLHKSCLVDNVVVCISQNLFDIFLLNMLHKSYLVGNVVVHVSQNLFNIFIKCVTQIMPYYLYNKLCSYKKNMIQLLINEWYSSLH